MAYINVGDVARAKVPSSSILQAIDVWTGSCIMFAFICLLEVVLVNLLHSSVKVSMDMFNSTKAAIIDLFLLKESEEPKGGTWRGLACFHTLRAAPLTHKLDIAFR